MPGTLDLDFMRVKRKTRSHPTSPKGSPTRTPQSSGSASQNESEVSVHNSGIESGKKQPRKSSDDGRYLFLAKPAQPEVLTQRSSSTPSTPVTGSDLISIDNPPQRSKSVRAFVELLSNSDNQKIIEAISTPKKEPSDAKRRVSRVCVILNDAELLVVSLCPDIRSYRVSVFFTPCDLD